MKFSPGDSIGGRFQVLQKLGEGGMGIVYLVHDKQRKHDIALKVMRPEISLNDLAVERFKREVEVMGRIDDPSMVKIYERGRLNKQLFYTMEFVRGESISRMVKAQGPMRVAKAVELISQICAALSKVHKVAVHRDISSDNVIVRGDGSIRILDFGTARTNDDVSNLTRAGMHVGKMCYSAPEQRQDSRSVDHRADLYSVGILLYEMLTGKLLYTYEPVTKYRRELSRAWDRFFTKALAPNPAQRYGSAEEMLAAIQELHAAG